MIAILLYYIILDESISQEVGFSKRGSYILINLNKNSQIRYKGNKVVLCKTDFR
jgi:hypothetical protein